MDRILLCEEWKFREKGKSSNIINLPHDAMQVQGRAKDASSGTGGAFFLGGNYEYEKSIWAPEEWKNKEIMLEFEGVYPSARIYLNEEEINSCKYGYSLFRVTLDKLNYNAHNIIKVEVDNSKLPNSRWYSGAGIYRPVWLLEGDKQRIQPDGVRVTTVSYEPAEICVETTHTGNDLIDQNIKVEIFYEGKKIIEGTGAKTYLTIPDAKLWNDESPDLYECVVSLHVGNNILDKHITQFGIRKIEWSPKGLFINGESVLLRGGCIHHDNGILGARSYDKSEYRRIKRLKENGFNAIRSSHNPLCRTALEACDRLGMYVMDETWDMWDKSKNTYDYSNDFVENYRFDIHSIVAKDYNHPSVIMYSIGNEVTEPGKPEGLELASKIIKKIKEEDPTRPVTAGINLTLLLLSTMENNPLAAGANSAPSTNDMNSTAYNQMVSEMGNRMTLVAATEGADQVSNPIFSMLDIAGYNYATSRYEKEGELHPERIIVGSETYTYDLPRNWKMVEKYPYLIGDFMWTAWDYLGEVGLGGWSYDAEDMGFAKAYPWLLANVGAFDILGNETVEAGAAAVIWGTRKTPYIGVSPPDHPGLVPNKAIWREGNALPYWSYRGCDGNDVEIQVYSSADEVELFINDISIKKLKVIDYKATFKTTYTSGVVKAVAYNADNSYHSESSLVSADEHVHIRITAEDEDVRKGDIVYIDISLTGENGEIECNQDKKLSVNTEGAELLAFGSANPKTEEGFLSGEYTTYYGRSQAVIKVLDDVARISVNGEGLETVEKTIIIK